jgi:acyl dehydratase
VRTFAGLSADFNQPHTNDEFARESEFGRRIAHGTLVLSMVTGFLFELKLFEEPAIAFLGMRDWRFERTVYPGDTIRAIFEVSDLRETSVPDRGLVVHAASVLNQEGVTVHRGDLVMLVGRKPTA